MAMRHVHLPGNFKILKTQKQKKINKITLVQHFSPMVQHFNYAFSWRIQELLQRSSSVLVSIYKYRYILEYMFVYFFFKFSRNTALLIFFWKTDKLANFGVSQRGLL